MRHAPQLDGLRALAVSIVLLYHWIPHDVQPLNHLGRLGVLLFFVLSGYLITEILLGCRDLVRSGVESPAFALRQFYIRRFLRIFPLYYTILAAGWLLNNHLIRETMAWHVSYASNFYLALQGAWHGPISHLWSLSVEEQFYLFWPAFILFLPTRVLPKAIIGLIFFAPIFRGVGSLLGLNHVAAWVLPFACLDTLGIGALLALVRHSPDQVPAFMRTGSRSLPWIGVTLLCGTMAFSRLVGETPLYIALYDTGAALISASLVAKASRGFPGFAGRALQWRPVAYLGKISYGVYLLHLFVYNEINRIVHGTMGLHGPQYTLLLFVCYAVATLALASLSWHFLEAPLNGLKRHFPYRQTGLAHAPA